MKGTWCWASNTSPFARSHDTTFTRKHIPELATVFDLRRDVFISDSKFAPIEALKVFANHTGRNLSPIQIRENVFHNNERGKMNNNNNFYFIRTN